MSERRARYRFEMEGNVTVTNKRTLAHLASNQIYDSLTSTNMSVKALEQSIVWLRKMHKAEARVLDMDVLEDGGEAQAEHVLRTQLLSALEASHVALVGLRARKAQIALQMEEDFDPLFKPEPKKPQPTKKTPVPPATPAQVVTGDPAPDVPTLKILPGELTPAKLVLDEALLAQARAERANRLQESDEN
jgi:hypothetical protein